MERTSSAFNEKIPQSGPASIDSFIAQNARGQLTGMSLPRQQQQKKNSDIISNLGSY